MKSMIMEMVLNSESQDTKPWVNFWNFQQFFSIKMNKYKYIQHRNNLMDKNLSQALV